MTFGDHEVKVLQGTAMRELLHGQIRHHLDGLHAALAPFEAASAVDAWLETLRAIEEFINLPLCGIDDKAIKAALIALPVDAALTRPRRLRAIRHHLAYRYGQPSAERFTTLLLQATAIKFAFASQAIPSAASFVTIGTAVDYFQSRRRHLVALLYTLPQACRGKRPVEARDTLNHFLPLAELNGVPLTGLHHQAMLAEAFDDYAILVGQDGFRGSRDYPALDSLCLEPERASIIEMQATSTDQSVPAVLEPVRRDRLFSAAELRNDIRWLEATYAEFDLATSVFAPAATLVQRLSEAAIDDYWITITPARLDGLADDLTLPGQLRRALVHTGGDYVANTNSFAPFINVAGHLRTSVTLLTRFLYYWKNVCLYKNRRFQIRSGFIFEQTIGAALTHQGFQLTGIKRINRKEFDVVTTRDGVIFNVQCKNNFIDLSRLVADVKLFARYNRARAAGYERALRKEIGREALLTAELGISRVEHLIVTRFPVATDNRRVIPFSRIDELDALATSLAERASG